MVKQRFLSRNQRGKASTAPPQQEPQQDWATLGQILEQLLRQQWLKSQPFQVRCAVREGTLLVLAEHLLHVEPDPEAVFTSLEADIRALLPEVAIEAGIVALKLPNELPVQLLLRISGYQQPYASRGFYCTLHQSPFTNFFAAVEESAPPLSDRGAAIQSIVAPQTSAPQTVAPQTEPIPSKNQISNSSAEHPDESEAVEAVVEAVILAPKIIEPEIAEPEVIEAEISEPEIIEPVAPVIDLSIEDGAVPQEAVLETVELGIAESEIAEPEIIELEISELEVIEPEIAEPEIIEPDLIEADRQIDEIEASNSSEDRGVAESQYEFAPQPPILGDLEGDQRDDISKIHTSIQQHQNMLLVSPAVEPAADATHEVILGEESVLTPEMKPDVEEVVPAVNPFDEYIDDEPTNESQIQTDSELDEESKTDLLQTEILEGNQVDSSLVEQLEAFEQPEYERLESELTEIVVETENTTTAEITGAEEILPNAVVIETSDEPDGQHELIDSPTENAEVNQSEQLQWTESESIEQFDQEPDQLADCSQAELSQSEVAATSDPPADPPADQQEPSATLTSEWSQSAQNERDSSLAETLDQSSHRRFRWSASNLGLASAVGGFVLVSGLYMLTRPCAVGACEQLTQARQLSQTAIQTAQTTDSALAVVEAYKQLNEANYLLATIPAWSRHHKAAQALLNSYEDQAVVLGKVVQALEQANTAAQKSQNPPHPLPEWREIQWLWRDVIAQLERIPPESSLYSLVQRKLAEYRDNLADINQRVGIEQRAQDQINAARQVGQVAEARAGAAQSAANWQETAATWTTAITQLRQIPQSTMVYDEAQQLLAIYQPSLTEANTRQTQELAAADAYTQALDAATQARTLEQQNQWSQAAVRWQSALTYAQQVPDGTSYHSQIQPLVSTYAQMLQQSKQNSQRSTAIQTIKPNLDRACPYPAGTSAAGTGAAGTSAGICTYTLSPQAIRVQFTSTYDQTVSLTINDKQPSGNSGSSSTILDQVNGSLRVLADVSEATQVPIELYNAKGTKLGIYTPSLSGYVPQ